MKKIFKSVIVTILCAVIAVTSFGTKAAYAADKTPIKVTFKKKSLTLYATDDGLKDPKVSTLKKKWGKPETEKDEYGAVYTWKKGKTSIVYYDNSKNEMFPVNHVAIDIKDKNASVCGLKVGMKKAAAKKILKKYGNISDGYGYDDTGTKFIPISVSVNIRSNSVFVNCSYKKNKVTDIYVQAYIAQ